MSAVDAARNIEIVSQMKGKAIPGGVHEGRFTSRGVAAPSCSSRLGRLAGRSAKTRERNERKKKRGGMAKTGSVSGSASIPRSTVEITANSPAVASGYLATSFQSMAPASAA